MGGSTKIEWTEATWNPLVGCKAVSPGCDHCYAAREASGRLRTLPAYAGLASDGVFTGEVRCLPERLDQPLRWKRPRRIFVNSMSDLFHPDVPDAYIVEVFDTMGAASQHIFQVLTKRPQRMRSWTERASVGHYRRPDGAIDVFPQTVDDLPLPNVWLGTSIESDRYTFRADHLRQTPAAVRFLSCEPLLGPLPSLDLQGIDWVIVGGESGPGARPMHPEWVTEIRDRCLEQKVAFLFKQWGQHAPASQVELTPTTPTGYFGYNGEWSGPTAKIWSHEHPPVEMARVHKKLAGRELEGRTWDEYPDTRA